MCRKVDIASEKVCPSPPIGLLSNGNLKMLADNVCSHRHSKCEDYSQVPHLWKFVCRADIKAADKLNFVSIEEARKREVKDCDAAIKTVTADMTTEEKRIFDYMFYGISVVKTDWPDLIERLQYYQYSFDTAAYQVFKNRLSSYTLFQEYCEVLLSDNQTDYYHKAFCEKSLFITEHGFYQVLYLLDVIESCQLKSIQRFIVVSTETDLLNFSLQYRKDKPLWGVVEVPNPKSVADRIEITLHSKEIPLWLQESNKELRDMGEFALLDVIQKLAIFRYWFHDSAGRTQMKAIPRPCAINEKSQCQKRWFMVAPSILTLSRLPTVGYLALVAHFIYSTDLEDHLIGITRITRRLIHAFTLLIDFLISVMILSFTPITFLLSKIYTAVDLLIVWVALFIYSLTIATQFLWFTPIFLPLFPKRVSFVTFSVFFFCLCYFPALYQDLVPRFEEDRSVWTTSMFFPQVAFANVIRVIGWFEMKQKPLNFTNLKDAVDFTQFLNVRNFLMFSLFYITISLLIGILVNIIIYWRRNQYLIEPGSTLPPSYSQPTPQIKNNSNNHEKPSSIKTSRALIKVDKVSEYIGSECLFEDLSLEIMENDIVTIAGLDSFRTKRLFDYIRGINFPSNGNVELHLPNDDDVNEYMAYQSRDLIFVPELTVLENIYFLAGLRGYAKEKITEFINCALSIFGIEAMKDQKIHYKDSSLIRKVTLIATFASTAKLYLLDNPTKEILDTVKKRDIWTFFQWIHSIKENTLILTTDDLEEAKTLGGRLLLFTELELLDLEQWKCAPTNNSFGAHLIIDMQPVESHFYQSVIYTLTNKIVKTFKTGTLLPNLSTPDRIVFFLPYPLNMKSFDVLADFINKALNDLKIACFYFYEPSIHEVTLNALYNSPESNDHNRALFISHFTRNGIRPTPPMVTDMLRLPNLGSCRTPEREKENLTSYKAFIFWLKKQKNGNKESKEQVLVSPGVEVLSTTDFVTTKSAHFHRPQWKHFKTTWKGLFACRLYDFRCATCTFIYILAPIILTMCVMALISPKAYKPTDLPKQDYDELIALRIDKKLLVFLQQNQYFRNRSFGWYNKTEVRMMPPRMQQHIDIYPVVAAFFTGNCLDERCGWEYHDVCKMNCFNGSLFASPPKEDIVTTEEEEPQCTCSSLEKCINQQSLPPSKSAGKNVQVYDLTYRDVMKWLWAYQNNASNIKDSLITNIYGMQFYTPVKAADMFSTCNTNHPWDLHNDLCLLMNFITNVYDPAATVWYEPEKRSSGILALTSYHTILSQTQQNEHMSWKNIVRTNVKKLFHPIIDFFYEVDNVISTSFYPAFTVTMYLSWIVLSQLCHMLRHRISSVSHLHFLYHRTEIYYWVSNIVMDMLHYTLMVAILFIMMSMFGRQIFLISHNVGTFVVLILLYALATLIYGYLWTNVCKFSIDSHLRILYLWFAWLIIPVFGTLLTYHIGLTQMNMIKPNLRGSLVLWILFMSISPGFCLCHGLFSLAFYHNVKDRSIGYHNTIDSGFSLNVSGVSCIALSIHTCLSITLLWLYRTRGAYLYIWLAHKKFCKTYTTQLRVPPENKDEKDETENANRNESNASKSVNIDVPSNLNHIFAIVDMKLTGSSFFSKCIKTITNPLINLSSKMRLVSKCADRTESNILYNFTVERKTCVGLVGLRNSGKSMVLRILAGITKPKEGKCYFMGNDISIYGPGALKEVAYCPQDDDLFHKANINETLSYFMSSFCQGKIYSMGGEKHKYDWVNEAFSFLNLNEAILSELRPSHAVKRKVSILATLMLRRPILIFDEPFNHLNETDTKSLKSLFCHLRDSYGATIVFSTMKMSDCEVVCNKVYPIHPTLGCFGGKSTKDLFLKSIDGYFIECYIDKTLKDKPNRDAQMIVKKTLLTDFRDMILVEETWNTSYYFIRQSDGLLPCIVKKLNDMKSIKSLEEYKIQYSSYEHLLWRLDKGKKFF